MLIQGYEHGTRCLFCFETMMRKLYTSFVITAIAGVGLASTGCAHRTASADAPPPAAPVVQVSTARVGTVERTLPLTATVSPLPNEEATVSTAVSGIVDQLPVRLGQTVAAGEVVAHLLTSTLTGQIDQAQATIAQDEIQVRQAQVGVIQQRAGAQASIEQAASAVASAQATLASDKATLDGDLAALRNAEEKLDRENALLKDGLVAQKDVEDAQLAVQTAQSVVDAQRQTVDAQRQTVDGQAHALQAANTGRLEDTIKREDVDVARAQVASAEGALRTAQSQLSLYTLRSPVSGQVASVGANLGETVDSSVKLVTIVNLDTLQLQLPIPAESIDDVHPGESVMYVVDGKSRQTVITMVGKQVDTASGTVTAYCEIPNPGHRLQDDQTVKATVTIDSTTGVTVPIASVLTDPASGVTSVAVVGTDDTLHVDTVEVGLESNGVALIKSGIKSGDQVAVHGQYGVDDGTKVSVQNGSD